MNKCSFVSLIGEVFDNVEIGRPSLRIHLGGHFLATYENSIIIYLNNKEIGIFNIFEEIAI